MLSHSKERQQFLSLGRNPILVILPNFANQPSNLRVFYKGKHAEHFLKCPVICRKVLLRWSSTPLVHGCHCHGLQLGWTLRPSVRTASSLCTLFKDVPVQEFCIAATWPLQCTFLRFYSIKIIPPSGFSVVVISKRHSTEF